jgi:hypothetical protein
MDIDAMVHFLSPFQVFMWMPTILCGVIGNLVAFPERRVPVQRKLIVTQFEIKL